MKEEATTLSLELIIRQLVNIIQTIPEPLATAIVTLIGGYFILGPTLRKQQKTEFQNVIGKKKSEALIEMKKLIRMIDAIEVYEIESFLEAGNTFGINNSNVLFCPEVMFSTQNFCELQNHIQYLRANHEDYLDREATAYLWYLDRYVMEAMTFLGQNKSIWEFKK